jgi:hypothetical protein
MAAADRYRVPERVCCWFMNQTKEVEETVTTTRMTSTISRAKPF